jgi:hypothetical protein
MALAGIMPMTAFLRLPDDQGPSKPPPTNRNNPLDLCKPVSPANDNEGARLLVPVPESRPGVQVRAAAAVRHALRRDVVVVAYGIVAFIAMIAWIYLLGLTMLSDVGWALSW